MAATQKKAKRPLPRLKNLAVGRRHAGKNPSHHPQGLISLHHLLDLAHRFTFFGAKTPPTLQIASSTTRLRPALPGSSCQLPHPRRQERAGLPDAALLDFSQETLHLLGEGVETPRPQRPPQ